MHAPDHSLAAARRAFDLHGISDWPFGGSDLIFLLDGFRGFRRGPGGRFSGRG